MKNFIDFIQKYSKIITILLIIILLALLVIIRFIVSKSTSITEQNLNSPTFSSEFAKYSPHPTIPSSIQPEIQYPVIFNSITVEYKPRSGIFLVFYEGPIDRATKDYYDFMDHLHLIPTDYSVEYRSLEPVSLAPAYSQENEN